MYKFHGRHEYNPHSLQNIKQMSYLQDAIKGDPKSNLPARGPHENNRMIEEDHLAYLKTSPHGRNDIHNRSLDHVMPPNDNYNHLDGYPKNPDSMPPIPPMDIKKNDMSNQLR